MFAEITKEPKHKSKSHVIDFAWGTPEHPQPDGGPRSVGIWRNRGRDA